MSVLQYSTSTKQYNTEIWDKLVSWREEKKPVLSSFLVSMSKWQSKKMKICCAVCTSVSFLARGWTNTGFQNSPLFSPVWVVSGTLICVWHFFFRGTSTEVDDEHIQPTIMRIFPRFLFIRNGLHGQIFYLHSFVRPYKCSKTCSTENFCSICGAFIENS